MGITLHVIVEVEQRRENGTRFWWAVAEGIAFNKNDELRCALHDHLKVPCWPGDWPIARPEMYGDAMSCAAFENIEEDVGDSRCWTTLEVLDGPIRERYLAALREDIEDGEEVDVGPQFAATVVFMREIAKTWSCRILFYCS